MREKEYTGTWSLHFQAPYVRHGRIVYRPVFHETVGRLGAKSNSYKTLFFVFCG